MCLLGLRPTAGVRGAAGTSVSVTPGIRLLAFWIRLTNTHIFNHTCVTGLWVLLSDEIPRVSSWNKTHRHRLISYMKINRENITVTSQWARWCLKSLKSPTSRLLVQPFVQSRSKKISQLHVTSLFDGKPLVTSGFPSQKARLMSRAFVCFSRVNMLLDDRFNCRWFVTLNPVRNVTVKNMAGYTVHTTISWPKLNLNDGYDSSFRFTD